MNIFSSYQHNIKQEVDMIKKIKIYEIIGYIFVGIAGVLFHFFYDWFGNNKIIGSFCPINESPWEHLKLIFFPMMIYTIFEYLVLGEEAENIVLLKYLGTALAMIFTITAYYTYSGIIGKNYMIPDIAIFYISIFIPPFFTIKKVRHTKNNNITGLILWVSNAVLFVIFSFYTPEIGLFWEK